MNGALKVITTGPLTSVQDAGRFGHQRFGVTPAGPMDPISFTVAHSLLGDKPTAMLEIGMGGIEVEAQGHAAHLAFAGPSLKAQIDGQTLSDPQSLVLAVGARLTLAPHKTAFCYLAVAGGFATTEHLGSRASHVRSTLGTPPIKAGDTLPFRAQPPKSTGPKCFVLPAKAWPTAPKRLALLPGPQADWFTDEAWQALTTTPHTLSPRSDRMGYRLEGAELPRAIEGDMISDGIVTGAIQVPPNGAPILLMADRQTTGGYPKIAVMASADIPFAAQTLPGTELNFKETTMDDAVKALKAQRDWLTNSPKLFIPKMSGEGLTSEALLAQNLVGGVVDARE